MGMKPRIYPACNYIIGQDQYAIINSRSPKQEQPQIMNDKYLKFIIYSLIGSFMFFIPITINGVSSIPIDHIVTWIKVTLPSAVPIYALIVILLGAVYPFISKSWSKDKVSIVFSFLKVIGAVVAISNIFQDWARMVNGPKHGSFPFRKTCHTCWSCRSFRCSIFGASHWIRASRISWVY